METRNSQTQIFWNQMIYSWLKKFNTEKFSNLFLQSVDKSHAAIVHSQIYYHQQSKTHWNDIDLNTFPKTNQFCFFSKFFLFHSLLLSLFSFVMNCLLTKILLSTIQACVRVSSIQKFSIRVSFFFVYKWNSLSSNTINENQVQK